MFLRYLEDQQKNQTPKPIILSKLGVFNQISSTYTYKRTYTLLTVSNQQTFVSMQKMFIYYNSLYHT